ncbi:MAG: reverse transcriptase domain-containing protein [Methylococcaceae bacterium]
MAKQYHDIFQQITEFSNIWLAWQKAARGKRSKISTATFEMALEDQLITLQQELQTQTWRPGGYYSFYIRDPKLRLISAAPFRDRVVHHALCNIIEPIFERTFIGDSYANRKGKGTHSALNKAQQFTRRYRYVLQCDIRQFFPSIDHGVLYRLLSRKIIDQQALRMIRQIINSSRLVYKQLDSNTASASKQYQRLCGLPLGNLTSQFWANVYMNELDQFVKRQLRCPGYLRYVDDFLLFSDSKEQLWQWKNKIRDCLNSLFLEMHERSSTVYPTTQGIPFLGFRIYADYRHLKRKNGVNFSRRLKRLYRSYGRGEIDLDDLKHSLDGWIAHVEHADTWGLRRSLFSLPLPLRHRR